MTNWCENCSSCIRRNTPIKPKAELFPINTTRPLELVYVDFFSLEKSKGGFEEVLVITDHFTRYAKAVPCRNQKANTTAKALYENFFVHYGFPERLHSDQGRNFDGKVIHELCKLVGVAKSRTTPYHPMGNGSAERFNRNLLRMLGTLPNDQKSDWKSYVAPLVQAYNVTESEATGFSPHFLMFGTHPRLSVDAYLGLDPMDTDTSSNPKSYAKKLRTRLKFAYDVAAKAAEKLGDKNKEYYDKKVRTNKLEVGDRVLVRKVGLKGKNKLADKWGEETYLIIKTSDNEIPVYQVRLESGKGSVRTLHRNMLLPFNCIPPNVDYETNINVPRRVTVLPKTRQTKSVRSDTEIVSESDSEVSDQDETVLTTLRQPRHSGAEIPRFSISGGTPSSVDLSIDHSDRSIWVSIFCINVCRCDRK